MMRVTQIELLSCRRLNFCMQASKKPAKSQEMKRCLIDGESNPGLLRDRRGYLPYTIEDNLHGALRNTSWSRAVELSQ